jgi:hypothetical protein
VRLRDVAFDMVEVAQVVVDLDGNLTLANERSRALFSLHRRDLLTFRTLWASLEPIFSVRILASKRP